MKKITLSDGREVTINKLTVRMMRTAMKREGEIEQSISMVSQTSGMNEDDIDNLPIEDFMILQKEVEGFLSVAGAVAQKMK